MKSLRQSDQLKQVRHARTCYDHLAGELGVNVAELLLDREFLTLKNGEYVATEQGKKWFFQFGINIEEINTKRGIFAKPCLDWSERRYHIYGWLGSAIATCFLKKDGLQKQKKIEQSTSHIKAK